MGDAATKSRHQSDEHSEDRASGIARGRSLMPPNAADNLVEIGVR